MEVGEGAPPDGRFPPLEEAGAQNLSAAEGRSAAVADRSPPVAEQTIATQAQEKSQGNDALQHQPSQRSGRRRRRSSRSTTSLHDAEKNPFSDPPLDPGLSKEARLPNPNSSAEDITALPRQRRTAHTCDP